MTTKVLALSEDFLLRTAGRPFGDLERLGSPATVKAVQVLLDLDREILELGGLLVEELFAAISSVDGQPRGYLVALKRSVFNEQIPPRALRLRASRLLAAPSARRTLARFLVALRQRSEAERRAREISTQELGEKRLLLHASLREESFQKALQLASPALFSRLRGLLSALPGAPLRSRERQAETGAYRYFARMVAKTSPFSYFGPVARGRVEPGASAATVPAKPARAVGRSALRLDLVAGIERAVAQIPGIQPHLDLVLNEGRTGDDLEIRLLTPEGSRRLDPGGPQGRLRRVKRIPPVDKVMAALEGPRKRSDLLADLTSGAPMDSPAHHSAAAFLDRLIQANLVLPRLPSSTGSPRRLTELSAVLARLESEEAQRLAAALVRLDHSAEAVATLDVTGRAAELAQLAQELARWIDDVGECPVVENVGWEGGAPPMGAALAKTLLGALGPLAECLAAREREGHRTAALMTDLFVSAYGSGGVCRDLVAWCETYFQNFWPSLQALASGGPESAHLPRARLSRAREARMARFLAANASRVEAPDEVFASLLAELGGPPLAPFSVAFHVQLVAAGPDSLATGEVDIVVNQLLPGFGRYTQGVVEPAGTGAAEMLADLTREFGPEVQPVPLLSVLDHNAQLPAYQGELAIVPPNERGQGGELTYSQLEIRHDPVCDRLTLHRRNDASGKALLPVYLGTLHALILPASHQIIAALGPTASHFGDRLPLHDLRRPAEMSGVTHFARVQHGRLILAREAWHCAAEALPPIGRDALERWRAVTAWRLTHGIPRWVFIRPDDPTAIDHKPLPIDFESHFGIELFCDELADAPQQPRWIEEMLPAPGQLALQLGGEDYVSELLVELRRGREESHA